MALPPGPATPLAWQTAAWLLRPGPFIERCLGASFATYEMRVVLQALVERLRLSAHDPAGERVRRRAIVLAPARGGRVVTSARPWAGRS
jgi:hypothetical protein